MTTPSKFRSVKNEFQARCHTDSQRVPFSENKFKASDITVVLSPGRELTASHMVDGIIVPGVSMTRVRVSVAEFCSPISSVSFDPYRA